MPPWVVALPSLESSKGGEVWRVDVRRCYDSLSSVAEPTR